MEGGILLVCLLTYQPEMVERGEWAPPDFQFPDTNIYLLLLCKLVCTEAPFDSNCAISPPPLEEEEEGEGEIVAFLPSI